MFPTEATRRRAVDRAHHHGRLARRLAGSRPRQSKLNEEAAAVCPSTFSAAPRCPGAESHQGHASGRARGGVVCGEAPCRPQTCGALARGRPAGHRHLPQIRVIGQASLSERGHADPQSARRVEGGEDAVETISRVPRVGQAPRLPDVPCHEGRARVVASRGQLACALPKTGAQPRLLSRSVGLGSQGRRQRLAGRAARRVRWGGGGSGGAGVRPSLRIRSRIHSEGGTSSCRAARAANRAAREPSLRPPSLPEAESPRPSPRTSLSSPRASRSRLSA